MMLVTNIREDGKPIGSLPDGEMLFHHDMCYVPAPDMATLLYAIEPTRDGGHTLFANMHAAYDTLSDELKDAIAGREVLQAYNYNPMLRVEADDDPAKYDHYVQPTVIVHPATGRKALYINQLMSARIEGIPRENSDGILAKIRTHLDRPELTYEHVWRAGDLIMWDNYCTCHARTDFPPDQTRLLRRCTVAGETLIAA
jgi:taurine dioxygenase